MRRKPILWWPTVARRETLAPRQELHSVAVAVSAAPPRMLRNLVGILAAVVGTARARYPS
jgi:hypothetical protein